VAGPHEQATATSQHDLIEFAVQQKRAENKPLSKRKSPYKEPIYFSRKEVSCQNRLVRLKASHPTAHLTLPWT
jgi:hypothetical protein